MTTPRAYFRADRTAITTAILAQMPTSYMTANLTTNWRGWRSIRQVLDLGAAGTVNAPAAGALYNLQATRPPYPVQSRDAPWARDYSLIVILRTQADPMPAESFVDTFDEKLKDRLKAVFDADSGKDIWPAAHWVESDRGATFIDTAHVLNVRMGD